MRISTNYYDSIKESSAFIVEHLDCKIPTTAIMMGTGLSEIVDELTDTQEMAYEDIPYFPKTTVQSHKGRLVVGKLDGNQVLILAGRWHYYEGYSTKELTFPIRVIKELGVERIIFTNVSGSVNSNFNAGDLIVIEDHINLIPDHPLRGENDIRLGPRFPDMLNTYDEALKLEIYKAGASLNIKMQKGVYLALQGPSLETPAEYMMIHRLGADLVGMSTVPEVIVAKHAGLKIAAISIVSNVCYPPESITETTVEEVIAVAKIASKDLNRLLSAVVHLNENNSI